jgi:hypothetical protein
LNKTNGLHLSKVLSDAIDKYLLERETDERMLHCFHPSSLAYCPRKLYEAYLLPTHVKTGQDPRLQRVFANGHDVHDRLQGYLYKTGLLVEDEVLICDTEFEICGHTDGLLNINGNFGVLELKSINKSGFMKLLVPDPDYIIQMNVYMHCLDLDWGILLYESKDSQEFKEFLVNRDQEIIDQVLGKILYVKKYIARGYAPPRHQSRKCEYCEHNSDGTCK